MYYFLQLVYSFFASISFAVLQKTPKKAMIFNGIIGAIGWTVYKYILINYDKTVIAAFLSAFIIGTLSVCLAIIIKIPTVTLYLPSIIPIVPGGGMYYTMYYLIVQDMEMFSQKGIETLLVAIFLAIGIFMSTRTVLIIKKIVTNIIHNN